MNDDNVFDFTTYREGTGNLVPCKRCGRPIPADSTQCKHCGLYYQGHASDFAPGTTGDVRMNFAWMRAVAMMILVLLAGLLLLALLVGLN